MTTIDVLIYGGGGFAREVAWLLQTIEQTNGQYRCRGFIDDDPKLHGKLLNNLPVFSLENAKVQFPDAHIVSGIGNPIFREKTMENGGSVGFEFATLIHPHVEMSQWIEMGDGVVICAGSILTTNIDLGHHVQINLGCTIGHDVVIGDFGTLAPGVHISGCVRLGKRVYIGTGAVIINGTQDNPIVIGDDVVVGAGACVTKSIADGQTVVGVPARPIKSKIS